MRDRILAYLRKEVPSWPDRREIEQLLRPCINLAAGHPRKTGHSRIGGAPSLPANVAWPRHQGEPLSFVMQIDLGEVDNAWKDWDRSPSLLPPTGAIFIFLSREDARVHRLIHTPTFGAERAPFPLELKRNQRVKNASLTARRALDLPCNRDGIFRGRDKPRDKILDLMEVLRRELADRIGGHGRAHQMLGYTDSWCDDEMKHMAQRRVERDGITADASELSRDFELLLTYRLDDGTDYTNTHRWGRGVYQWGLTREELARGELEKAECKFRFYD